MLKSAWWWSSWITVVCKSKSCRQNRNARILSSTAMYVSSSSFMYLRIPCYCDARLNSSALRVGVTTLLNTIQYSCVCSARGSYLFVTSHQTIRDLQTHFCKNSCCPRHVTQELNLRSTRYRKAAKEVCFSAGFQVWLYIFGRKWGFKRQTEWSAVGCCNLVNPKEIPILATELGHYLKSLLNLILFDITRCVYQLQKTTACLWYL